MSSMDSKNLEMCMSSTVELTPRTDNGKSNEIQDAGFDKAHPTTDLDALLHVVKSSLGTGVLATADGFKNGGLLVGAIGTVVVGFFCAHCSYIMVKSSQDMCDLLKRPFLGYTETVEEAVRHCANKRFTRWAKIVRVSVESFMFFTYYGVNTVYVILVADSLKELIEDHTNLSWNIRVYIAICFVPIFVVGMIHNMKYLVPFSALANVFMVVGLGLTIYLCALNLPPIESVPLTAPPSRFPLFFSTVLFGMEGIGTILPIENSMKNPKHFLGCPGVLNIGMCFVVSLFVVIGSIGFWRFGEAVEGSITLSLDNTGLAETVKALIGLSVMFTYGLQMAASIDVVWRRLRPHFSKENEDKAYYCTRAIMICGTFAIAIAVPTLAPVISLIGALGFSMCGFFYPAVVESLVHWDELRLRSWLLWKNLFFVILTVVAVVSGCIASIRDIIQQYE